MSPEVSVIFRSALGVKPKYEASEDEVADVLSKFATVSDCYGPSSSMHRSREYWDRDSVTGLYVSIFVPGNQTGCLSPKSCNLNSWNYRTEQQCLQQTKGGKSHFCSQCQNEWCQPITKYSQCCTAGFSYDCRSDIKKEECLRGPFCDAGNNYCDPYCSKAKIGNVCPTFFEQEFNNTCVRRSSSWWDCQNLQGSYHGGRQFEIGKYDTEDSCKGGACDYYGLPPGSTPEQCRNTQYCTRTCRKCESARGSKEFCLVEKSEQSCNITPGMNWRLNRCQAFVSNSTACSSVNGTWIKCSSYDSPLSCGARSGNECRWNFYGDCENKAECEAVGQCDDWEFHPRYSHNGLATGVCTYRPETLYRCQGSDWYTKTGHCVSASISSEEDCKPSALQTGSQNYTVTVQWKSRAKTKAQCEAQGTQCLVPKKGFLYLNDTECSSCQGKQQGIYTWNGGVWKNGTLLPTQWEAVRWKSENQWKTLPDQRKFEEVLELSLFQVIGFQVYESFSKKFTSFANIYKFISCDCTKSGKDTCFDEKISVPLKQCSLDPNAGGECSGVQIDTGMFGDDQVVSIEIDEVSATNYIEGTSKSLNLDEAVGNSNIYAVINCYDSNRCGQLVGNGKYIKFSSLAVTNVTVCLDKDLNIDQDTVNYPVLDFAKGSGDDLGSPLRVNVTEVGNQYCGSVNPFTSATWFPIRRMASFTAIPDSTSVSSQSAASTSVSSQSAASTSVSSQSAASTSSLPSSDKRPLAYLSTLICLFATL
jgi:hypothetical protein